MIFPFQTGTDILVKMRDGVAHLGVLIHFDEIGVSIEGRRMYFFPWTAVSYITSTFDTTE